MYETVNSKLSLSRTTTRVSIAQKHWFGVGTLPRSLNDATCLEHVEYTFESIENFMKELDLITTQ